VLILGLLRKLKRIILVKLLHSSAVSSQVVSLSAFEVLLRAAVQEAPQSLPAQELQPVLLPRMEQRLPKVL